VGSRSWVEVWAVLCLDGDVGSFIWVALSGSFSSLEHDGRQMLGLRSRRPVSPKHEGESNKMKVYAKV
jgi:hypothetical protein